MRRMLAVVLCGFVTACGSSSPATPSAPPAPPLPTPPASVISEFSGSVSATNGGQRLSGISVATATGTATTDSGGAFSLKFNGTSTGNFPLTLSGAGIMTHAMWLQWPAHTGITLDAITLAPPFDMTFYRQLARGAYDHDTISPLSPWKENPSIYIRTVDATGRSIEPEVLALVIDWSRRSVPMWSAGKLQVATIETGPDDRRDTPGWIVIQFTRDFSTNQCGSSLVGFDPGRITLNNDRCNCGSVKVPPAVVLHEFGHALGFFHVPDRQSVMYPQIAGGCPLPALSPAEQYHSAIVYNRPRGNTEPDNDPPGTAYVQSPRLRLP